MWFQILKIDPEVEHELRALEASVNANMGNVPDQQRRIQEIQSQIDAEETVTTGKIIAPKPMTPKEEEATGYPVQGFNVEEQLDTQVREEDEKLEGIVEEISDNASEDDSISPEEISPEDKRFIERLIAGNKLKERLYPKHPRVYDMLADIQQNKPVTGVKSKLGQFLRER